jgi:hypothetical protein
MFTDRVMNPHHWTPLFKIVLEWRSARLFFEVR